jgi:hypothetical protein
MIYVATVLQVSSTAGAARFFRTDQPATVPWQTLLNAPTLVTAMQGSPIWAKGHEEAAAGPHTEGPEPAGKPTFRSSPGDA